MSAPRVAALFAAGAVGFAAIATILAGPAEAAYVSQGIASAQGVHVTVTSDSVPIFTTPVDASEPLAAAAVDARGDSTAQAAYPYGGDTVTYGVSGAVAPDLPAGVALPAVPANDTSSFPATPSAKTDATAYQLDAESAAMSSTATAVSTADASNVPGGALAASGATNEAQAAVTTVPTTGMVTATASATAAGLTMGSLILGQVTSSVTMTRLPGHAPTRAVVMTIGKSSVLGQTIDLGPAGITVPTGSSIAVPDEAASINQALSASGITVTYLSEIDSPDGTVAPGVEVSQQYTDPTTGQRTDTTYVFGQSSASVIAGGAPDQNFTFNEPSATTQPSAQVGPTGSSTTPQTSTAVIPSASPTHTNGAIAPVSTDGSGAITAPPATIAAAVSPPQISAAQASGPASRATDTTLAAERAGDDALSASGVSFYLVLVGAAIAVMASSSTLRALGVRLLWTR